MFIDNVFKTLDSSFRSAMWTTTALVLLNISLLKELVVSYRNFYKHCAPTEPPGRCEV